MAADDDTDTVTYFATVFSTPKGGLYGGPFSTTGLGLDPNVNALIMGSRWTTAYDGPDPATHMAYYFAASASDFGDIYPSPNTVNPVATFTPLSASQQAAVLAGVHLVASYTNLTFTQAGTADDATLLFGNSGGSGSEARFPPNDGSYYKSDSRDAGDVFLGSNGNAPANFFGTDDFNTIIHEMGHAFGLKHGHDASYSGALAPQYNDNEFSVMTYASYLGANTAGATAARDGSSPQSYMMFDIAALQAYYGANFSKVGTAATYTWDNATGQQFINGLVAPDTGVSSTHKIFSTVWTQGALTTYDLSNFSDNQVDDLRPGHWLTFSHSQLADLNSLAPAGTPLFMAQGNIYNTLLYNGGTHSEIGNLITGIGNDSIICNDLDNTLNAGAGSDVIQAVGGDDIVIGGPDADTIYFQFGNGLLSNGHDVLRDTLADLNGDQVWGFGTGFSSALDVLGVQFGPSSLHIASGPEPATATFNDGSTTVTLNGNFTNGDFMVDTRGSGADQHTTFSFVQYLPELVEGRAVGPSTINGVANQPFLTGDGSVQFTLNFESAISYFANTLGYYQVSADGTIHDVHVLFGNTLNVLPGQTAIDLGVPNNDERIGFFLIQDGFDKYGNLPDDLFLLSPTTNGAATLNQDASPVLLSASEGALTAAQIFYSFDRFNPGGAPQVLSGILPGGHDLKIGFEDLPNGVGDNDFQDVVINIHASHGYMLS